MHGFAHLTSYMPALSWLALLASRRLFADTQVTKLIGLSATKEQVAEDVKLKGQGKLASLILLPGTVHNIIC